MRRLSNKLRKGPIGIIFLRLINNKLFIILTLILIIANTIILSLDRYPIEKTSEKDLENANMIFTIWFSIEFLMNIVWLGVKNYTRDKFNIFDGVVAVLNIIEIILDKISTDTIGGSSLNIGSTLTAFWTLRLLRVLKLARSWSSLRNLLKAMG